MACIGQVVDIQEGYVGASSVLQFVVKVTEPVSSPTATKTQDEEYVVVRCIGERVPRLLLLQQIRVHTFVFVSGILRLNRQRSVHAAVVPPTDKGGAGGSGGETVQSSKDYAFPYIQISPPFGFIKAL
ncbi:hypothetical protein STCU_12262 [Strigomonas culicis]|uniref:Uncharacterized protein n=1 Tax=Strigomonas culicis TaxID=28005 RepID=S9UKL9_9TRYP|nr:hypothetical protein STCU_12262 [Strigomonas culicis]|eukprot:EPY15196.1 hypothetical protein STCU_12262 [Strigomonas culicis]